MQAMNPAISPNSGLLSLSSGREKALSPGRGLLNLMSLARSPATLPNSGVLSLRSGSEKARLPPRGFQKSQTVDGMIGMLFKIDGRTPDPCFTKAIKTTFLDLPADDNGIISVAESARILEKIKLLFGLGTDGNAMNESKVLPLGEPKELNTRGLFCNVHAVTINTDNYFFYKKRNELIARHDDDNGMISMSHLTQILKEAVPDIPTNENGVTGEDPGSNDEVTSTLSSMFRKYFGSSSLPVLSSHPNRRNDALVIDIGESIDNVSKFRKLPAKVFLLLSAGKSAYIVTSSPSSAKLEPWDIFTLACDAVAVFTSTAAIYLQRKMPKTSLILEHIAGFSFLLSFSSMMAAKFLF